MLTFPLTFAKSNDLPYVKVIVGGATVPDVMEISSLITVVSGVIVGARWLGHFSSEIVQTLTSFYGVTYMLGIYDRRLYWKL